MAPLPDQSPVWLPTGCVAVACPPTGSSRTSQWPGHTRSPPARWPGTSHWCALFDSEEQTWKRWVFRCWLTLGCVERDLWTCPWTLWWRWRPKWPWCSLLLWRWSRWRTESRSPDSLKKRQMVIQTMIIGLFAFVCHCRQIGHRDHDEEQELWSEQQGSVHIFSPITWLSNPWTKFLSVVKGCCTWKQERQIHGLNSFQQSTYVVSENRNQNT